MKNALLMFAVAAVLLVGCTQTATDRSAPGPTPAGDYSGGAVIVLENGMAFTVPDGWTCRLATAGAAIDRPPADSAVVGATLSKSDSRGWSMIFLSVYGPRAGFDAEAARLDVLTRRARGECPRKGCHSRSRAR